MLQPSYKRKKIIIYPNQPSYGECLRPIVCVKPRFRLDRVQITGPKFVNNIAESAENEQAKYPNKTWQVITRKLRTMQ